MDTAQVTPEAPKVERKKRVASLQARFDAFEVQARERLQKALWVGQNRLTELDERLARVSRDDWSMDGMRKRFEVLRTRTDQLRANALKRVSAMPGTAVSRIATGTRLPVQNLARELGRLSKLIEPRAKATPREFEVVSASEPKPARVSKQKVEA